LRFTVLVCFSLDVGMKVSVNILLADDLRFGTGLVCDDIYLLIAYDIGGFEFAAGDDAVFKDFLERGFANSM